jgi:hypothetical protein
VPVLFWTALVATILYSAIQQILADRDLWRLKREAGIALNEARARYMAPKPALSITATAYIRIKGAIRYDKGGTLYHALLHVGSAADLAKRPGGHLVYCLSEGINEWRGRSGNATEGTNYNLIFGDGDVTEQAKSMTVDEILDHCDTALIAPIFLYGNGSKILGGTVTLTINAKSKKFTIFPQSQQGVWDWIQAN